MHLHTLIEDCFLNSVNHGFWDDYDATIHILEQHDVDTSKYTVDIKLSKIALICSELCEGLEGIRTQELDKHCPEFTSEEIEFADAIIRICDYACKFDLRLPEAIVAKMTYNKTRPAMHGKLA